jgi:hypothetical protein
MTDGGEGISGYKHTKEWKEKFSKWNKEHPSPKEVRDRICAASPKGVNHPHYGKPRTKVTKDKISLKNSGKNNGMFGKVYSEEEKKLQSERFSGNKNPMYGITGSKAPNSQWEYTFKKDNRVEVITKNLKDFCKEYNLNYKYLFKCFCIGRTKYKGWTMTRIKYEKN